jgi:hypothetical protein
MVRPRGAAALIAPVALLVATGLTLGPAAQLGLLERPAVAEPVPSPDPAARTSPGRAPGPGSVGPPMEPRSAPALTPAAATAAPMMVSIAELAVVAPVDQVGVLPDGSMEIPDDIRVVGWYATEHRRVSPGDPGTAVLAGHRDSRTQGLGALHGLERLEPGSPITVVHADGLASRWEVEGTLTTPRDALPADVLFAREGTPRLALVTCGGTFDARRRSYSHNIIVLARLVDAGTGAGPGAASGAD